MRFLIYLLLFLPLSMSQDVKMFQIYGKVSNASVTKSTNFMTLTECTNGCYVNPNCSLAYFNESCLYYDQLAENQSILVQEGLSRNIVVFKTDISNIPNNTCPESYTNLKFSLASSTGEKYSWTRTTFGWKFVSCRTG